MMAGKADGGIPVHCAFDAMVSTALLVPNPRNPNTHPEPQVELLAKILLGHGWRCPITVSKRSGFIVRGHGRLLAAQLAGLTECPVDYQDYADEASEWLDLVADNRIAELSQIDRPMLKDLLEELDTGAVDMDLSGFTETALEQLMSSVFVDGENDPNEHWQGMPEFEQEDKLGIKCIVHFECPADMEAFEKLIGQKIPTGTKAIWYPAKAREDLTGYRCGDES